MQERNDVPPMQGVAPGSMHLSVPTITIATDFDGANASGTSYRKQFSGKYAHRIFPGFGHNVPQEDPQGFAQAVIDVDGFS
jgi:pimeloyl-ACP methyl ester carboxylesterase